jgi:asparagine synthase (glutamine-hydrolysing)
VSGICGICQPDAKIGRARLTGMLSAVALPGETVREIFGERSVALGASQRWRFQQVLAMQGLIVAVDADLYNLSEIAASFAPEEFDASQATVAEVVCRLYLRDGFDFVQLLQGAFSIAIWDESKRQLLLAVDRFGFKTIYWNQDGDHLLFGSRIGAVRSAQGAPSKVNPAAITQFLVHSMVPAPLTVFQGIQRLEPGFLLVYQAGRAVRKPYWDLEYVEDPNPDEEYWAQELREQMRAAVYRHLDGCTRDATGAYLSGGTDSSSVVAFMSDRFAPVNTFSMSFQVGEYNEAGFSRTTADHFSTRHHERCLSAEDAIAAIPKVIAYYDEPFANSSAIASYHCALMAHENGIDTLLAGDGGDELFGGNARYASDKQFALYERVPRWLRRGLIEPIASVLPAQDGKLSLPRRYIRRAQIPNPRRIMSYNFFLTEEAKNALEPDFLAQAPEHDWMSFAETHFQSARASSELNRLLYMDVKMTLADNDLRKVSGTAELAGVRVRYPLLDTKLAEFSGRIPAGLKLKGMKKRYIFKKAMRGILPEKVLYKKKHGFGVPLGHWLLQNSQLRSLARDVLGDARTRQRGYFRRDFLDKVLRLHEQGHTRFYGELVWYLVALELWHREHLESCKEASFAG